MVYIVFELWMYIYKNYKAKNEQAWKKKRKSISMVLVTSKLIIILIIWLEETFHFFLQKPFLSFTNHTMSSDLDEFLKEVDNISKSNEENEFSASSTANPHVLCFTSQITFHSIDLYLQHHIKWSKIETYDSWLRIIHFFNISIAEARSAYGPYSSYLTPSNWLDIHIS